VSDHASGLASFDKRGDPFVPGIRKQFGVSDDYKLPTSSRDRDVEAPIVENESSALSPDQRQNHNVPFSALKPLDSVDNYTGILQTLPE
jgi:hypothetical protein